MRRGIVGAAVIVVVTAVATACSLLVYDDAADGIVDYYSGVTVTVKRLTPHDDPRADRVRVCAYGDCSTTKAASRQVRPKPLQLRCPKADERGSIEVSAAVLNARGHGLYRALTVVPIERTDPNGDPWCHAQAHFDVGTGKLAPGVALRWFRAAIRR